MSKGVAWLASPFEPPDEGRLGEPLPVALERVVERSPDAPAVLDGRGRHRFRDLFRRACQLAHGIDAAGVAPGPVGWLQAPGLDAVAAWFACAMAGRAFLLLDAGHPDARIEAILRESGATLVACDDTTAARLPGSSGVRVLNVDDLVGGPEAPATPPRGKLLAADAPAMIFPTSGSTGAPKLVVHSARTLQVRVQSSIRLMRVPSGARVLVAGTHGNFGFLHHALVFLLSGGSLCLADVNAGGFEAVAHAIVHLGARHARFTPSLFRAFAAWPGAIDPLQRLDALRFSGEPLLQSDLAMARRLLRPTTLVQNVYGSTESSLFIWSQGDEMDAQAPAVPIGHVYPLSSHALRRLGDDTDAEDRGELLLRSDYHALGEMRGGTLHRAGGGVDEPGDAGEMYATGDVVRRLPGGGLVHLGRLGRLVKVRGHRVFLNEVENQLLSMPGIVGAAVVERAEGHEVVLHGFVTTDTGLEPSTDPRRWLRGRLPDSMIPQGITWVPAIPLLPGGKVNYPALLAQVAEPRHPPREPAGDGHPLGRLARIWDDVLGPGSHRLDDSFLGLGGDSLKLLRLAVAVEQELGVRFPTEAFLRDSTLPGLASQLGIASAPRRDPGPAGVRLRRAWPGQGAPRRVALVMPGYRGVAPALAILRSGWFPDHDIWAADVRLAHGHSMRQHRNWWHSALEIVDRLHAGEMPTPDVVVGHSIGGSIAWLVGRLLAATPRQVTHVIMLDSAPMHRLGRSTRRAMLPLLAADPDRLPAVLHVHRPALMGAVVGRGNFGAWRDEDHVQTRLEVPTVSHSELGDADVLRLATPNVMEFLAGKRHGQISALPPGALPSYGGRLFDLHARDHPKAGAMIDDLLREMPARLDVDGCLALILLLARRAEHAEPLRCVLRLCLAQHPGSRLLQYAQWRLARDPAMLCPSDSPRIFPASLALFEKALASQRPGHGAPRSQVLRWCLQALDGSRASVSVWKHATRNMLERWRRAR